MLIEVKHSFVRVVMMTLDHSLLLRVLICCAHCLNVDEAEVALDFLTHSNTLLLSRSRVVYSFFSSVLFLFTGGELGLRFLKRVKLVNLEVNLSLFRHGCASIILNLLLKQLVRLEILPSVQLGGCTGAAI